MKKLAAALLCLVMLVGCVSAEETVRTGQMTLEGVEEEFVEMLYRSGDGYEIWYPSEYLTADKQYGHDCFYPIGEGEESGIYFMIVPSQADAGDAEALLAEAVGGFGSEAVIEEMQLTHTPDGALMGRVQATEKGTVYRYYLLAGDQNMLLITACFPTEAMEGFGARFDRMAETISFMEPDALYEGDGYSIGYFSERMAAVNVNGHEGFMPVHAESDCEISLMIVKSGVAPENADALLDEAVGGYEGECAVTRGEEQPLAGGLTLQWIQAEQEGMIDRYYLIKGEQAVYCLTATFPATGEAEYGVLFDVMAKTVQPIG